MTRIDRKSDGIGAMGLESEFLKKAGQSSIGDDYPSIDDKGFPVSGGGVYT